MSRGDVIITLLIVALFGTLVEGQEPDITERILPEIRRMGVSGQLRCVVINQQVSVTSRKCVIN